jgi:4'-phosphopantetheinyl transferase
MPLVRTEMLGEESAWALWRIEESEEELAFSALEQCPDDVIAPEKRKEFLAGRSLIKALVEYIGKQYVGLRKDSFGKPHLKDLPHFISLSHSTPYVAAQIHPQISVGIDVEQPKEKLLRVASRVLEPSEQEDAGTDIVKHCVYWCAKEALYKIHGKRGLSFALQLNLDPFELKTSGNIIGHITVDGDPKGYRLSYIVENDFVLVCTIGWL